MPRYEFKDGKSNKFWEIELSDDSFTTRYGRIGTDGQETTKSFDSAAIAKREHDKLVAEKTKKGYVLVGGGGEDGDEEEEDDDAEAKPAKKGKAAGGDNKKFAAKLAEADEKVVVKKRGGDVEARVRIPEDETAGDAEMMEIVEALFAVHGDSLRKLVLSTFDYEGENHYPEQIEHLEKLGAKPGLRELFIGDFEFPDENEISWVNVGDVGKLWKLYPNLESLTLQGAEIELGKIDAPNLKSLTLRTGGLPKAALKSIAAATFPKLESLEVWTGSEDYGADSTLKGWATIFDAKQVPKLKHLGVRNSQYAGAALKALVDSTILAQLESLDVSMGTLTDEQAQVLLDKGDSWKHLKTLDVSQTFLSAAMCKKLAKVCAKVARGEQRTLLNDDEGHHYVAVGE